MSLLENDVGCNDGALVGAVLSVGRRVGLQVALQKEQPTQACWWQLVKWSGSLRYTFLHHQSHSVTVGAALGGRKGAGSKPIAAAICRSLSWLGAELGAELGAAVGARVVCTTGSKPSSRSALCISNLGRGDDAAQRIASRSKLSILD